MKKNENRKSTGTPFLAAKVPATLRADAEAVARERGWSLGTLVREAVKQYLSSTAPPVEDSHRKVDGRSRSWLSK